MTNTLQWYYFLNQEKKMLENLNSQNFDPESYMEELDELLDQKIESVFQLKKQLR